MRRQIYVVSFAVMLCSGATFAQAQQAQTDYQRAMNAANNASSQAFGQPQPDPNVIDSTGDPQPNGNTSTATPGTNTPTSNIPLANQQNSNTRNEFSLNGNSVGATTTTGTVGLGSYNTSPYNNAPNTMGAGNPYGGGRGAVTPSFTGQ